MNQSQIIQADWTWTGRTFQPDVQVRIDDHGRIADVGPASGSPTLPLTDQALLPGFVNVHSHAFQRGLRGYGESFPKGQGSFWTWRERMYELVSQMTPDRLYDLTLQAYTEMRRTGITTVGEFHYLHHDESGVGFAMDQALLRAARDAGIRLVLLECYYRTGAVGLPLRGGQLRFSTPSVSEFLKQIETLSRHLDSRLHSLAIAPHSIRAVPLEDIVELRQYARRTCMVCHMHVEEQRREIEECQAFYHATPMELILSHLDPDPTFTAIHCTHTAPDELERYVRTGANVCLCPLSEANLGDGLPDVPRMRSGKGRVCLGTDSNARLCMTEELRWLEYLQRLRCQQRGMIVDEQGDVAPALLEAATVNGAHALQLQTGRIEKGHHADFLSLDLTDPALNGSSPDTLLTMFLLGVGEQAIAATCIAGKWSERRRS